MSRMLRASNVRLLVSALILANLSTAGCYKWSSPSMPLDEFLSEREGQQVRLTLSNGRVVRLKAVSLLGDSLVGATPAGDPRAVALDDVIRFEVRKTDALKTTLVVVPVVGTIALLVVAIATYEKPEPVTCSVE